MRILIVTHAPISAEFGAGQMAINLTEAFKKQGHKVVLWSPHPLPSQTKWWQRMKIMRSNLDDFIQHQSPFDLIDCPALLITKDLSESSIVVARSVQPDLLYLFYSLKFSVWGNRYSIFKSLANNVHIVHKAWMIIQGWHRAKYIFCLGSVEFQWMNKWFPWWKNKLSYYVNALSQSDRKNLTQIRQQRKQSDNNNLKFLWIGRWATHKGTNTLINFIEYWITTHKKDTFTIAGCGEDISAHFSQELIKSGKLKIIPSFGRDQLNNLLSDHNVGLFTSKVEGWGLVLNEMLESGMPVFATSAGGVGDLKPFASNKLQSFPPSCLSISDAINNNMDMNKYYEVFTWEKIAQIYENSVLNKINYYTNQI